MDAFVCQYHKTSGSRLGETRPGAVAKMQYVCLYWSVSHAPPTQNAYAPSETPAKLPRLCDPLMPRHRLPLAADKLEGGTTAII